MVLNIIMVISFVWAIVDFIRGLVHHANYNFDYPLVRAMSIVWLVFGVLALCNSIAIQKIIDYLESKRSNE